MAHLGQDVAGAMATRDQLLAIATEPDLDGNGKLFAFCLLAYLHERRRAGLRTADWIEEVGARMHPTTARPRPIMDPTHLVHRAIANDVPRYEIPCPRHPRPAQTRFLGLIRAGTKGFERSGTRTTPDLPAGLGPVAG